MQRGHNHDHRALATPRSGSRSWYRAFRAVGVAVSAALLLVVGPARAVDFDIDFRTPGTQVLGSETFAELEALHYQGTPLGSVSLTALEGVAAPVYAGVNQNYSLLMTTVLDIDVAGDYVFQVGTDWGLGGGSVVIDNDSGSILYEYVTSNDIWWDLDWTHSNVFDIAVSLSAGSSYTIKWVGFEDCCGGDTTIRFSVDGGAFQTLDQPNLTPFVNNVPEPGTALLLGVGIGLLAAKRRPIPSHVATKSRNIAK